MVVAAVLADGLLFTELDRCAGKLWPCYWRQVMHAAVLESCFVDAPTWLLILVSSIIQQIIKHALEFWCLRVGRSDL
jgi:hypothetical protein